MSFKKIAVLIAITCIIALVFVGCGGDNKPASSQNTGGDTKATAEGVTQLELWHIQTSEPFPKILQDSVDRFNAENPNVHVNVVIVANDAYKQKISIAMGSGQLPDIFPSWSGGPMIEYIKSDQIQDLTKFMDKDGYKDKFLDAAIEQATYQDKIYGVPVENVAIATVWYNKKLFDEYGLKEPQTLEELEAICETIKSHGKTPFSLANKSQWTGSMYFMNLATRFGGLEPFQKAVSGEGSFIDPSFEFAGNKIQEWVDKGYFNVGFNGADEDSGQSRQLLYTEDAVMTVMGNWFAATVMGENMEFYKNLGTFNFPAVSGSSADPNIVIGTIGSGFYHISSKCKDTDAAFKAITALLDDIAIKERVAAGRIPPLKGITVEDPLIKEVVDMVNTAPTVQLWYDQYLPPEVSDVHKTTTQEIFGKTMTPLEAEQKMQDAMQVYLAKSNKK